MSAFHTMDSDTVFFLCLIVGAVLIAALIDLLPRLRNFRRELDSINREIRRCRGTERSFWVRKRRALWCSLIPFFHK